MSDDPSLRLARIAALLADLDTFAPRLWPDAPSYRFDQPLTEAAVQAAESTLGVSLPEAYRGFLLRVGGTGPGPDYGLAGPSGWAMPAELPQVSATVTTVHGDTSTAGTGDRPTLAGTPDPARPFPLTEAWSVEPTEPSTVEIPAGAHLYDGCVHLNDIGCGYSSFLVVSGPQRGMVWVDYSAGDGDIAPVAPFLDWYEEWLDGCATALLSEALGTALNAGSLSPYDEYLHRWAGCFERMAPRGPQATADLAALRLYQRQPAAAQALIAELEALELSELDSALDTLTRWSDPAGWAAAGDLERAGIQNTSPARVRRRFAANPAAPPEVLAALAEQAEAGWAPSPLAALLELDLIARNPATTAATLTRLATLPDRVEHALASSVTRAAALHPALPPALLVDLAGAAWPWVRAAVASHPRTSADLVARLTADDHPAVRVAVGGRADTADDLLSQLATDPVPAVRAAVAANPATPAAALRHLGADVDSAVTFRLARNPSTPPEVLAVLADDPGRPLPDPRYPDQPEVAPGTRSVADLIRSGAAADPGYPYPLLAAVIAEPDVMRGYTAGSSPWLDEPLLRALAAHPYSYARQRVLDQPSPPADLVIDLAGDPVPMVVRAAAARPEIPAALAVELAGHDDAEHRWGAADCPNLPAEWLRRLAGDADMYVRRAVLTNPGTPLEVVARLAADPEPLVRLAAGRRSELPESTVESMLADPDESVVRAARWYQGRARLRHPS